MRISLGLTTVLFGEGLLNVSTSTSSSLSLKYVSQVKLMSERFNNNRVLKETVEGANLTTAGQAIISIIPSLTQQTSYYNNVARSKLGKKIGKRCKWQCCGR